MSNLLPYPASPHSFVQIAATLFNCSNAIFDAYLDTVLKLKPMPSDPIEFVKPFAPVHIAVARHHQDFTEDTVLLLFERPMLLRDVQDLFSQEVKLPPGYLYNHGLRLNNHPTFGNTVKQYICSRLSDGSDNFTEHAVLCGLEFSDRGPLILTRELGAMDKQGWAHTVLPQAMLRFIYHRAQAKAGPVANQRLILTKAEMSFHIDQEKVLSATHDFQANKETS